MNLLCKLGLHWPLQREVKAFTDAVSGKQVWLCRCNCGTDWLAEGRYSLFKVKSSGRCWRQNLPGVDISLAESEVGDD